MPDRYFGYCRQIDVERVGPIDQDGHGTWGRPVPDAQGPRQTQRNVASPGIAVERDRLALARAIIAIGDEVVLGHGSAQQLDRGVLQWQRKRDERRGMASSRLPRIAGDRAPARKERCGLSFGRWF